ncbi:MAG: hypothetical protein O3B95_04855 [Chloroflexi bacterium]|nr:hypothetical protein [Chloroflexota bacterium]
MQGSTGHQLATLLGLMFFVVIGSTCSITSQDGEPETPTFPLSAASDQAWVEMALPWAEIQLTCLGIGSAVATEVFARSGETIEIAPGETAVADRYTDTIWKMSRSLREGSRDAGDFRSFYLEVSHLKEQGLAAVRLEIIEQYDFEITNRGTALVATSASVAAVESTESVSNQIYIFDGARVANVSVISSPGARPYCDAVELESLVELVVRALK